MAWHGADDDSLVYAKRNAPVYIVSGTIKIRRRKYSPSGVRDSLLLMTQIAASFSRNSDSPSFPKTLDVRACHRFRVLQASLDLPPEVSKPVIRHWIVPLDGIL